MTDYAIKHGYRHVDSATVYRNEAPSSKGMLKSGVSRDQLFFTSKVPPRDVNYKGAKKCVDESLKKTGYDLKLSIYKGIASLTTFDRLDYIDLYLLHAPYGGKEGRIGAW